MTAPKTLLLFAVALLMTAGCDTEAVNYQAAAADPELLHMTVHQLTKVTVHDIFSPPLASRAYAYPSIAAYEALVPGHPSYVSLAGQVNDLTMGPQPEANQEYVYPLAAVKAFLTVAEAMVFSVDQMADFSAQMDARFKAMGIPRDVYNRSEAYGKAVGQHILNWADGDQYKQTRSYPKFTVTNQPGRWQPTPPAYLDGIEPHWREIRPFVMDSASQFRPAPPTPFDTAPQSTFLKETREVYDVGQNLTEEQQGIAAFWDCNPYVMHTQGHVMFATKKITPGGHWMGIAAIAARKADSDFMESAETYARLAMALADAFISSWDEKYRSNLIRPETVINQHIDETWEPLLQTPPFPEHTSGHSVISSAAAIVLTDLYGEPFAFKDTTEVSYGLPARSFESFIAASEEAAISRLYGGIHYRPAIEDGITQGRGVGNLLVSRIETHLRENLATSTDRIR